MPRICEDCGLPVTVGRGRWVPGWDKVPGPQALHHKTRKLCHAAEDGRQNQLGSIARARAARMEKMAAGLVTPE